MVPFSPLMNKANSLLQEVCINCFISEYMYVSVLQNGWVTLGQLSIKASTRGVYQLLQIQIYVSLLQNGRVKLGSIRIIAYLLL